jgi:uncharacterized OB-fold protein
MSVQARADTASAAAVPIVSYLVLAPTPHLVAQECTQCGTRFFDRRNACASCSGTGFRSAPLGGEGTVRTFTIVHVAAPGIKVPFVAAIVDVGGTRVRANLINVPPDTGHVRVGLPVRLAVHSLGTDDQGTEAIGFGFEPVRQFELTQQED